jgi:2-polyprenyl-3-methyl-5-hydroxy-6-metoxy-1,4-benzoquinol methylase
MKKINTNICSTEQESWEASWKWKWFTREQWMPECWVENQARLKPLLPLLRQWQVGSMLDCSCGLGMKTILFAKAGFKVEGSDASPEAIRHAPELAEEEGQDIKFFLSRYEELGDKCREKFDCMKVRFHWSTGRLVIGRPNESNRRGLEKAKSVRYTTHPRERMHEGYNGFCHG